MKVLLISANRFTSPYPVYPLGLDYIAQAIEDVCEHRTLDLCGTESDSIVAETLTGFEPDLVGISIRNIDNTDSFHALGFVDELCRLVEVVRQRTQAPIVLGGSGYSLFPKQLLQITDADFGIVGAGERLRELIGMLKEATDWKALRGVFEGCENTQAKSRRVEEGQRRLPSADRASFYVNHGGMLNLQSKRGCPFSCVYCTYPLIEGRKLKLVQPELVAQQALALQEIGARYLFLADSVFNADRQHAYQVASAFREQQLQIPWGAFLAPMADQAPLLRHMAGCGCTHAEFGTDSLSETMLRAYGKAFSVDDVFRCHTAAVEAGLHVAHYVLLGGPQESEQTVAETLTAMERLPKAVFFIFCGVRIYPDTSLWKTACQEGQIQQSEALLKPIFYQPRRIGLLRISEMVEERAASHLNWVVGTGGEKSAQILDRLYARGRWGPLWEYLIK